MHNEETMGGKIKYRLGRAQCACPKWHMPSSKPNGAGFCKQVLLVQSCHINRCVNDDNMCMNKHRNNSENKKLRK